MSSLSIQTGAIGVDCGSDIPPIDVPRRDVIANRHHRGMTNGMTIGEALSRHAGGCDCLVLRR
jgi:hypothetical protein